RDVQLVEVRFSGHTIKLTALVAGSLAAMCTLLSLSAHTGATTPSLARRSRSARAVRTTRLSGHFGELRTRRTSLFVQRRLGDPVTPCSLVRGVERYMGSRRPIQ